jgi:hypothetical protein
MKGAQELLGRTVYFKGIDKVIKRKKEYGGGASTGM